jgi:ABC-type multidrug transport system fused ATPase/permease subunit
LCNFTGTNITDISYSLIDATRKPIITSIILGFISLISGYIRVTFSNISAERQSRTIRQILFQSILKKDIVYFDQHKTGELNSHLTDDVNKICDGIGDKLCSVIEMISTCMSCIVVGKGSFVYQLRTNPLINYLYRLRYRMGIITCYIIISSTDLCYNNNLVQSETFYNS